MNGKYAEYPSKEVHMLHEIISNSFQKRSYISMCHICDGTWHSSKNECWWQVVILGPYQPLHSLCSSEIYGSHSGAAEDSSLQGFYAVSGGE